VTNGSGKNGNVKLNTNTSSSLADPPDTLIGGAGQDLGLLNRFDRVGNIRDKWTDKTFSETAIDIG
jgi:hypothetical protein